jgi:ethanolamine utilization protein EutA
MHLIGLDFGSTTSSAIVASARVLRNCATGRMELGDSSVVYRSDLTFTPFRDGQIDGSAIASHIDRWIRECGVDPDDFAGGGAIITGLAAQNANVAVIERLVKDRFNDVLFATADDPCLESWLAFMGSTLSLSRSAPNDYFLNLDIGGGTTNLALGIGGEVLETGCLFAGARHFQFTPGTYQISALSSYAERLLRHFQIDKRVGQSLTTQEVQSVVDFYTTLIEAAIQQDRSRLDLDPYRLHEQVRFSSSGARAPIITLSGGVGALVYDQVRGLTAPETTAFGDLGIDLARGMLESPIISRHVRTHVPSNFGHATVYGLSLHSTEVSGSTLYIADPGRLPLRDLPIVARIGFDASQEDVRRAITFVRRSVRGGCVEVAGREADVERIRMLGSRLANALGNGEFPTDRPVVLIVAANVGKSLGSYASQWGRLAVNLIVIDELCARQARFASLGTMRDNVVPVAFYGIARNADGPHASATTDEGDPQ